MTPVHEGVLNLVEIQEVAPEMVVILLIRYERDKSSRKEPFVKNIFRIGRGVKVLDSFTTYETNVRGNWNPQCHCLQETAVRFCSPRFIGAAQTEELARVVQVNLQ